MLPDTRITKLSRQAAAAISIGSTTRRELQKLPDVAHGRNTLHTAEKKM